MANISPQLASRPEPTTVRAAVLPPPRRSSMLLPNLLTGLVTVPALLGLLGARTVGRLGHQLSQQSEELLRGDQLPLRE